MRHALILDYVRTPIGRFGGVLAPVRADDLAAHVIKALVGRNPALDQAEIEEVIFGCANQAGEDNRNVARMGALLAGLPTSVPGTTINRLCASGLDAVGTAARAIVTGEIDLAIAGGVESMSRAPFVLPKAEGAYQRTSSIEDTTIGWRFINPIMKRQYGVDSMPETAENVADEYQIARADQDAFALRSQQRYARAAEAGWFQDEISEVQVPGKKGNISRVTVDEHARPDTTLDGLAKLKPIVRDGGTVTAGNASGVNDGAAALLVASEVMAGKLGAKPLARVIGMASAGVPPRVMGIGPVPAVGKLCERLGLRVSNVDVIELNEAFASQALACLRQLGLPGDSEHVNPHGGAIALGHPLGMSGARIAGTAARALSLSGGRYAIATMCVGVGQGVALALERVS
jgi:3-oxoadipyl-CoA thiolase